MRLGVTFPQNESGSDPGFIRDFAQTAEALGYSHILAYDHVLGADPDRPGGWRGVYSKDDVFHEPLVMFAYLAGITTSIEFVTGVLILPQRQTALVAKQVAELDLLAGGRLRLGIGTGWNAVEYEALTENFHNRGRRQEEQVEVMRQLWQHETIDYRGRWHRIDRAGINPLPGRAIPIWFGGNHENVLKRAARIGDGWLPLLPPGEALNEALQRLDGYLAEAGRSRAEFGLDGVVNYVPGEPDKWRRQIAAWREVGATHVTLRTLRTGLAKPQDHIDAIRLYKEAVDA